MKPHLSIHMDEVITIALCKDKTDDEKTLAIKDIFELILVETGYIDQRRVEAEEAMKLMLVSLRNNKTS